MATTPDTPTPATSPPENQGPPPQEPSASERRLARRRAFLQSPRGRVFLIGAIIVVLLGGFLMWRYFTSYEDTDDAEVDGHLQPLSARINGYILHVNVDDNQQVKAGYVLAEIDPRDYQVAVDQARANLAESEATARAQGINVPVTSVNTTTQVSSSQADVSNAQAGITAAQEQLDAAKANLVQDEANDVKAQDDVVRYKQLVDKLEVSEQTYDYAVAAAKASAATVVAARASIANAEQQVSQAQDRLASAQAAYQYSLTGPKQVAATRARADSAYADVLQKRAALEQAELNLQYTRIVAPVDGVVQKNIEVGMNVQPGQQLMTIVPLNEVWVTANFKETQMKYMHPGQRAIIHLDANGRDYKGHVDSIPGASGSRLSLLPPENATGNYVKVVQRLQVKITIDPGEDSDYSLRLGESVEPKVYLR